MTNHSARRVIYFDNAATAFPKPECVIADACRGLRLFSGNPGRSSHKISRDAASAIFALRHGACEFFGCGGEDRVIITQNTTHSLNLALNALVSSGDGVLCSNLEHNAVRRVLLTMKKTLGIRIYKYDALAPDTEVLQSIERIIRRGGIRVLVTVHSSNVISRTLPLKLIGDICRRYGVFLVADCAQSAGHVPIHLDDFGIDALCLSGHKGLFAPPGIGLLMISEAFKHEALKKRALVLGGTGIDSLDEDMPSVFPERFEAGTQSAPLCLGLLAGIRFIKHLTLDAIAEKERLLGAYARDILLSKKGVTVYRPDLCSSILSFNVEGYSPERVAEYFDEQSICLRAGLHCAPDAHAAIGSLEQFGGSVRLSLGHFNTLNELDAFKKVLFSLPQKSSPAI